MNSFVNHRLSCHLKTPSSAPRRKSSRVRRKPGEWWKAAHLSSSSSTEGISGRSLDISLQSARTAHVLDVMQGSRPVSKELYTNSSPQAPECLRSCSSAYRENIPPTKKSSSTSFTLPTDSHLTTNRNSDYEDATQAVTKFRKGISDQDQISPNLFMTDHPDMQVSTESNSEAGFHDPGHCSSEDRHESIKKQLVAVPGQESLCVTFNGAEKRETSQNFPDPNSESSEPPRTLPSKGYCAAQRTCDTTSAGNRIHGDNREKKPRTFSHSSVKERECDDIGQLDARSCRFRVPVTSGSDTSPFSDRKGTKYPAPNVPPGKNLYEDQDLFNRQRSPGAGKHGAKQLSLLNSLNNKKHGYQTCLRQTKCEFARCMPHYFHHPHISLRESAREELLPELDSVENDRNCSACFSETCTCVERAINDNKSWRGFTVRRASQLTYNTQKDVFGVTKVGIRSSEDGVIFGELTLFPMSSTGRRKATALREYYVVLSGYLEVSVEDTTLHLRRRDEVEFCEDTVFQLRNPCVRTTDLFCLSVTKL